MSASLGISATTLPCSSTRMVFSPMTRPIVDGIESPFLEDAENFFFAALLGHQQHAFLRFAQHDLVRGHAGFALRHQVEFDFQANAAPPAHLASGAGQPGRAHILNADDGAGLHGFQTGFEQQLFQEWIADLHVGALRLRMPSLNSSLAMVAP